VGGKGWAHCDLTPKKIFTGPDFQSLYSNPKWIEQATMSFVKEEACLLATTVYDVTNTDWSQKYFLAQKILGCRAPYAVRRNIKGV
jgi:hypothetical protein